MLSPLGDKKANKTAEEGGGGVSEMQFLIFQQNNVNPCKSTIIEDN